MASIREEALEALRDYVTNGVPSSGAHEPSKQDLRDLFTTIDRLYRDLATATAAGAVVYNTRAELYADLAHAANTMGWVINDTTDSYIGVYKKSGASGAGSWSQVVEFNDYVQAALDAQDAATAAAASQSAAATSATNAATSATNASTSATNAATSETNAATAKTNAETAEANAEAAQALAEAARDTASTYATNAANSAADAALDGGEIVALQDGTPRQIIYNEAGYAIIDVPGNILSPADAEDGSAYWTSKEDTGVVVHKDATLNSGGTPSLTSPYIPELKSWFWVKQFDLGATVRGFASWDKKQTPEEAGERVTLDATNGLVIPADVGSRYNLIIPATGHSDSQGSPDYTPVTSTALDTGNALMLSRSVVSTPYIGYTQALGITDLLHSGASTGESPFAGAADAWLAGIDAYGAKIPTIFGSVGVGGAAISQVLSKDRAAYWAMLEKFIQYAMYFTRQAGKTGILGPLHLYHFDPSNAASYGNYTPAAVYLASLRQLHRQYNDTVKALTGIHPDAPLLPVIGPQSTEEDSELWSGGNKVFSLNLDSCSQAQFLTLFSPGGFSGFICCGPTYAFPVHTDNQHLTSTGNYLSGHQAGRYMTAYAINKGLRPIHPYQVTRNSTTQFTIKFALPTGQSLAFDTTTVADALDGFKGFVAWRADTAAQVTITSVAISGTDSVVVQHSSVASTVQMWCDYALWADNVTYQTGRNRTYGPRGNLRGNASFSTTNGGSYYDWCMRFRIPIPDGTNTWDVGRAMARYI